MLKMNKEIKPKEPGNLLSSEIPPKIEHTYEKDRYKVKIYLLFHTATLLFSICMLVKSEGTKTKDIISSFDYYNTKIDGFNSERNYLRTNRYLEPNNILNSLLFFDPSQEIFTKPFLPFKVENTYYFLSCLENALLYKDSSQIKLIYNILNKFSNANKFENDSNLEINKETKFASSLKNIFYKTILDKDVLSLSFSLSNYYKRREEKRREKLYSWVELRK